MILYFWRSLMKKLATAIAAIALMGTPAFAADLGRNMPVKAPPPAPAPVYNWSGWYVGVNAGGTWSNSDVTVSTTNVQFCAVPECTGGLATALASAQGTTGAFPGNTAGFIGGGQLGYNWQFTNSWIAGFEADIQGIADRRSDAIAATVAIVGFPGTSVTTNMTVTKEVDYLGTVRGRLGWLPNPTLLAYGTGGLAYGGVKASTSISQSLNPPAAFGVEVLTPTSNSGISETRTGWTAGGGFEWRFAPQWSVKAEYLYYDLGRVTFNGVLADAFTTPHIAPAFFTNNVQTTTHFNGNIARVGLNYQFH
jgi:outer membrane immunogenic protein